MERKMNTPLEIQPYVGVGPLKFGMTADEVAAEIGLPDCIEDEGDEIREFREKNDFHVVYAKDGTGVVEMGFGSGVKLLQYDSMYVFKETPLDVLKHIVGLGNKPYESLGFLVFLDIGITFTGFHDLDEDDDDDDNGEKAVTVFKLGRWDDWRDKLSEYKI